MRFIRLTSIALLLAGILLLTFASLAAANPPAQTAAEGEQLFKSTCTGCHTIGGGKLVGPDLQGVTQKRSEAWLTGFIKNPQAVINSGDPDAVQLAKQFNGIIMPTLGLTDTQITSLIVYLKTTSGGAVAATQPSPALPAGDPTIGEKIFTGEVALTNGGLPCTACHTVTGVGLMGGGTLGPNLTHAFTKYGGATGMGTTLSTLPFPTMQGIFATRALTPTEQADLLAFFQKADQNTSRQSFITGQIFLVIGLIGAGILLLVLIPFWPKQRESIAEKLRKSA